MEQLELFPDPLTEAIMKAYEVTPEELGMVDLPFSFFPKSLKGIAAYDLEPINIYPVGGLFGGNTVSDLHDHRTHKYHKWGECKDCQVEKRDRERQQKLDDLNNAFDEKVLDEIKDHPRLVEARKMTNAALRAIKRCRKNYHQIEQELIKEREPARKSFVYLADSEAV